MSDVFSLRLPKNGLKLLKRIARRSHVGPTQLARTWLLERLAMELQAPSRQSVAREPTAAYETKTQPDAKVLPQDRLHEIAVICRRRGVKRLGLFGSAARGEFDPGSSDLDFTVEFLDMPLGLRPDAYFGLVEELERLFGTHVDLVDRDAVTNPYLRAAIDEDEVTLYEAS